MPLAVFPKCFLDSLCVHGTMTVEQWVTLAADHLDVDGLEFYWGFTPHGDDAALGRLRHLVETRGLSVPMLCCSPDFTQPDAQARAAEVARQRRAITVTAALGGQFCRVLSGQRRPGVSRDDGIEMAADAITELLPDAERQSVTLILENHYKDGYWQYPEFAQKREDFLELLSLIPRSPWFGVNFDPSNALIAGEDPIVLLEAVKDRVVTLHASDRYFEGDAPVLKHGVIGRGLNDYDRIFSILKGVGFQGWVSIEDGQDPATGLEDLRLSAQFLRAKMREYGLP